MQESIQHINLSPVDYVLIGIAAALTIKGLIKGLSHELSGLIVAFLAIGSSLFCYAPVAGWIMEHTRLEGTSALVTGFTGSLIVLWLGLKLIGMLLHLIMQMTFTPSVERFGGLGAGLAKAGILTAAVLMTVRLSGHEYLQRHLLEESRIGQLGNRHLPEVYAQLAKVFPALPPPGPEWAAPETEPEPDPDPQSAEARPGDGV